LALSRLDAKGEPQGGEGEIAEDSPDVDKLMGSGDEKEAEGGRIFSSGSGVETESGKNM